MFHRNFAALPLSPSAEEGPTVPPQNPLPPLLTWAVYLLAVVGLALASFWGVSVLSNARPFSAQAAVFDALGDFAFSPEYNSVEMFNGQTDVSISWKGAKPGWRSTGRYDAVLTLTGPLPDHALSSAEISEHNTFLALFKQHRMTMVTLSRTIQVSREHGAWTVSGLPSTNVFFSEREKAFLTKGMVHGVTYQSAQGAFNGKDGYYSVIRNENPQCELIYGFLMLAAMGAVVGGFARRSIALGGLVAAAVAPAFLIAVHCFFTFPGLSFLTGVTFG